MSVPHAPRLRPADKTERSSRRPLTRAARPHAHACDLMCAERVV